MGLDANTRCPECDTKPQVTVRERNALADSVVKATSEEVIMEIRCRSGGCSTVWRAVYSFSGNQ